MLLNIKYINGEEEDAPCDHYLVDGRRQLLVLFHDACEDRHIPLRVVDFAMLIDGENPIMPFLKNGQSLP